MTAYTYDALNRRLTIQWPDHVAGTSPGDQHYGIQATAYDAAGRALRKTDQRGDTISLIYDLAGRMLRRECRTGAFEIDMVNATLCRRCESAH